MALSCSRRKYSRCDWVICSFTRLWILTAEFEDLEFLAQELRRAVEAVARLDRLEDLLLLLNLQVEVEGYEVGEPARLLDRRGGHDDLLRDRLAEFGRLLEVGDERPHQCLGLDVDLEYLLDGLDAHQEEGLGLDVLDDPEALLALDERLRGAVRQLELLHDRGDAADLVDVLRPGFLSLGAAAA